MEQALRARLALRQKHLCDLIETAKAMLESEIGIPFIQFSQMCLKLKTAIGALEKETFLFIDKCQDEEGLVPQCTEAQMMGEEVLASLEAVSQVNVAEKTTAEQVSRLPKLDLCKFNGDILKWTEFWDKFEANIDSRNLKDVDKLSYLLSTLEGAALETVEGLGATNANYTIAVDVLQKRYGAKDKVVDAHYAAINNLTVAANLPSECRRNLNHIEKHLRILAAYGENIESNHLRVAITSKFPGPVLYQVKILSKDSRIAELRDCLEKVITAMEHSSAPIPSSSTNIPLETSTEALHVCENRLSKRFIKPRKHEAQKVNFTLNRKRKDGKNQGPQEKKSKKECVFCNEEHYSDQCEKYSTVMERKQKLGNKCYVCFREGHRANKCIRIPRIRCYHCKRPHNSALCNRKFAVAKSESDNHFNFHYNKVDNLLTNVKSYLQTATAKLIHNNKEVPCRLLLDSGSQRSYLTTKMAKELDLTTDTEDLLVIFTFGSTTAKEMPSPAAEIKLLTKRGIERDIRVNLVPHITDKIPVPEWNASDINVDICADDNSLGDCIDLLIGNDCYFSFIRSKHQVQDNLFLVDTDFGWLISGNYHEEQEGSTLSIVTYCQCHEPGCPYFSEPDLPLRTIDMKFLWALESIGITDSPKTTREEEAVKHFNSTVEYSNGRYEVKWPWIEFPPELPTNFGLAYGRLKSLLRRSNDETIKEYQDILKEQLEAGIIEIVESRPRNENVPVHYLPHHIVQQNGKRGRIVYDASAKLNGKKSLNECLYRGPSMIEDMTALILQFRTGEIGITADVEKAFLQVGLQENDREVTRFLWVKDLTAEPTEDNLIYFRFCRVPFGIISSPFLLTATIRYHFSRTNQSLLKRVADKCYVDNLVINADSICKAKEVYEEAREAFGELAMNIRDWTSNSEEFMASIPESQRCKKLDSVKVLGLLWDLKDDTLRLNLKKNMLERDVVQVKTKKDVLRMLARFYDPCGFIAPLVLPAKLLFQELCAKKLKWDSVMPDELKEKWNSVVKNLQSAKSVALPRHTGDGKEKKPTQTQGSDEIRKLQKEYFPDEVAGKTTHLTRNLDNALQFKLTSQVLSEPYCKENEIQWKFIPQLAPWHGAFYERLIAIVKHCLKRTIDKHLLQDTQLLTVIKEVESVVELTPPEVTGSNGNRDATDNQETTEHLDVEPIQPEPLIPEQPEARDGSNVGDVPVAVDEAVDDTGEAAVVDEVTHNGEELMNTSSCGDDGVEGEPTRKKRDAAIKAKEKIAEWTRQLFILL
ncbi:uncharacterized protein [Choristoneura fumiferana]|uniref:uncharacterized protein n=1 Tax=Choristoneura fumiferana TaxID=7141 RepID=UPI003D154D63